MLILGTQIHSKSQVENRLGFCTNFQLLCETRKRDFATAVEEENFHS